MSALASRAKKVFRLSTPRTMQLRNSGSSRGCCWSTATGHTQGMGTCESDALRHTHLSHPSPQDCKLLLQEHRLYWCTLVVPNILWLEFTIVRLQTVPSSHADAGGSVFEYTYLLWWNSFWTIAPVIAIGLFDRIVGM